MVTHSLLIEVAVVLLAARLFAEIAVRLRAPPIIGELCAGIIIGPSLLGWVTPSEPFRLLAEIGIILLLFEVGLETDLQRLARAGPKSVVVALTGFVLPFLLGGSACYYLFGLSPLVALFIGGTLTATSIGITIRILSDLGRHRSHEGQIVLGAAVIDDLLGVFLLAVLYEFAMSGSVSLANSGKIMIYVGGFFLLAPVFAKILSPVFKRYNDFTDLPGMIPVVLVSIVLIFAELAHIIGAPHLLGGFAAGIALSRRFFLPFGASLNLEPEFTACLHEQMKPIIRLFTPIFFVMVGLSMDLGAIDWSSAWIWVFSIGIATIAIIAKLAAPFLIRESIPMRIAIGMAMVPRGEVGLIFAELGRTAGLFDASVYAGLILVIAYTTLAAPFWIKLFYSRYGDRLPPVPD
ncbi:MAG: cation:proton antiporter [Halobacteria archaeon]|nr:cation:proton antiporter [Halobacteria archaeon]